MNGLNTLPIRNKIPKYTRPINRVTIPIADGRLLSTIELDGTQFDCIDDGDLESSFEIVKSIFSELAKRYGKSLAVWTHVVKMKDKLHADYKFDNKFVSSLNNAYIKSFDGDDFYSVKYYLSLVFKYKGGLKEGERDFLDLIKIITSSLSKFKPNVLKISEDGSRFETAEFLSFLLNNRRDSIPLTREIVSDTIQKSGWHFGYDTLELRNNEGVGKRFATFYELKALPVTSKAGMWDFILSEPVEFVLTQSMVFMKGVAAKKILDDQLNLIKSTDNAKQEKEEIENAQNYVSTGDISFGDYHCSLAVFGDTVSEAVQNGIDLNGIFMSKSSMFERSNLKSEFSFFSMLPGSKYRIMPSPRVVATLVCGWSLHNYPKGKAFGNPIGDGKAILPLKTTSKTIYYLNLHASEENKDVTGKPYAGHTLVLGASGAGKTTLEGLIVAYFTRYNPQIFCVDYNRANEIFLRAYGGQYFVIEEGECAGINPFQFPSNPSLRPFLINLVEGCAQKKDGSLDDSDPEEIRDSVDSLLRMEPSLRSFSVLLQSIQSYSLRSRLAKWCHSEGGELAWCLDAPINKFNPYEMDRIGFDATLLLDKDTSGESHKASEPMLAVLFYLKRLMQQEGRLLITLISEFWMPANHKLTQAMMKKTLKAGRSLNEFMILSSQSPEDAIACELFPAIVQQTATKIYLPNPDAEWEAYKKCNVTNKEFFKLKKLDKTSRKFLIKQSNSSCFAGLDLHGFDDYLPVLSGTKEGVVLCNEVIQEFGEDPDIWVPEFIKRFNNK
jgi:type IV secretion system protein VirB4